LAVFIALGALAAGACGKRGDPLPPLPRTPQPVANLKLAQRGALLEIAYVAPRSTTGGARLGVIEVETLRAESAAGPSPRPSAAPKAPEGVPGAAVAAAARAGEAQKAIAEFQKAARGTRRRAAPGESLTETAPLPPVGTTVRVAARVFDGGRVSTPSPIASLTVQPVPPAPHDLVAELRGETVALRWAGTVPSPAPTPVPSPSPSPSPSPAPSPSPLAPPGAGPSPSPSPRASLLAHGPSPSPTPRAPARGFFVYRRADPGGSFGNPLGSEPLAAAAFEDKTVSLGQRWCYEVGTVVSTEPVVESARSNEACVSVHDIVPPAAPSGVAAVGGADGVEVSWSPSTESDLASYRVYRAAEGKTPERIGEVAAPETSLRDTSATAGSRYLYTVTAVDKAGNESPPSAPAPGTRP
jgi:hypothetical protein